MAMATKSSAEVLIEKILEEYGFSSIEEMKKSEEWARAFSKTQNAAGALQELSKRRFEGVNVNGWYLGDREFLSWNDEKKTMDVTAKGPRVVLEGGDVVSYANNKPLDLAPLSQVQVGPVDLLRNVEKGETKMITQHKEVNVKAAEHDGEFPDLTLAEHLGWEEVKEDGTVVKHPGFCNAIQKGKKSRGVINGTSGERFPVYATLTVGDYEEISYFGPNEYNNNSTLRVIARDSGGRPVAIKLPIEQVNQTFGIDTEDREEYRAALEGQPIFVGGQVTVLQRITADQFNNPEAVEAFIKEARDGGYFTNYSKRNMPDGTKRDLLGLNLNGVPEDARSVEIAGRKVYDVRQEWDKRAGDIVWVFYEHVDNLNKPARFDCIEKSGTTASGYDWTINEGAFVTFLAKTSNVDVVDKFSEAAKILEGL